MESSPMSAAISSQNTPAALTTYFVLILLLPFESVKTPSAKSIFLTSKLRINSVPLTTAFSAAAIVSS
jgi:hypothetical protein